MDRLKSFSFVRAAIATLPMLCLLLLVLGASLVVAGQANTADKRAEHFDPATADSVPNSTARVERPSQIVPVVIALGDRTSVLTYWVDEPDGFHVITTVDTILPGSVDQGDHHAIVRFSTTIQPGEMQNDFRARALWFAFGRNAYPSVGRPNRGVRRTARASLILRNLQTINAGRNAPRVRRPI